MKKNKFDDFRSRNPEFSEQFCEMYFQPSAPVSPRMAHCGFLVSNTKQALDIVAIKQPKTIYCGNKKLLDLFTDAFPSLLSITKLHTWYEGNAFLIIDDIPLNGLDRPRATS